MSEQQKAYFAIIVSACLHVLAALFLVMWTRLHPMGVAKALPDLDQLQVTLMPAAKPTPPQLTMIAAPTPPPKVMRSTLDTEGLQETKTAPANPVFESDKNSQAASELPATGDAPLPTQQGKTRPFDNFTTHNYSLGKGQAPVLEVARPPQSAPPAVEKNSAQPRPTPRPTPLFNPTPVPSATPAPLATPPNAYALGKPTPVPVSTPEPTPAEQMARLMPTPALRAHTEAPRAPVEPGYQPELQKNKIEGGISNRGKAGVDAVATPLGRYRKSMADAIGSRWYFYVNHQMDLITVGDVHIKFYVNQEGRVEDVKILSNTANETFGNYCIQSVTEAKLPPLPPDVAPALINGRLEIDYHFNVYPQ